MAGNRVRRGGRRVKYRTEKEAREAMARNCRRRYQELRRLKLGLPAPPRTYEFTLDERCHDLPDRLNYMMPPPLEEEWYRLRQERQRQQLQQELQHHQQQQLQQQRERQQQLCRQSAMLMGLPTVKEREDFITVYERFRIVIRDSNANNRVGLSCSVSLHPFD